MQRTRVFLSVVAVLCLGAAGVVVAQDEAAGGASMQIQPTEIYGCQFREDQGWPQLEHVVGRWNEWMDARADNSYFAYLLAPMYHSAELTYDVLWAGGWADGAAMAKGQETWVAEGGEMLAEFDRVVSCDTIINFATLPLSTPEPPMASGPIEFSNCSVQEGHEFPEALAAVQAWIGYETEHGITANHFMLFPAFGEASDADYDFKWVTASSWEVLGKAYDQYGTGGGWQKADELFKGMLECDSSRLYQATRVRAAAMGE